MSAYRTDLPQRPTRMARLPLDRRGYPVPWFVAWIDGQPDFRVVREAGRERALHHGTCWLCGEPLGRNGVFVIGPMCGINGVSSEPPSHKDCAEYAARACPFLTRPLAARNERGLDALGAGEPGGVMIKRNPGVTLLWSTREWRPFRVAGGVLVHIGEPSAATFWREGRLATGPEIAASVDVNTRVNERRRHGAKRRMIPLRRPICVDTSGRCPYSTGHGAGQCPARIERETPIWPSTPSPTQLQAIAEGRMP